MNPADLLNRLEAEGIGAALNLKVTADRKPSNETRALIQENRDTLLEYLAGKFVAANVRGETHLTGAVNVPPAVQTDAPDMTHGSNYQRVRNLRNTATLPTSVNTGVTLYGDLLHSLMVWAAQHQELRIEHPNGVVTGARPESIKDAVELHPWGLVYDIDRRVLVSWGAVPTSALLDKRDLATNEPFIAETKEAA